MTEPRILVYSSLFPSPADPNAGVFIRERMFRVAQHLPIVVVSPKAWSPIDAVIRFFRPRFRPKTPRHEVQNGIDVHAPRFFSLPGVLKQWDSFFMALGSYMIVRRLSKEFGFNIIDAHFGYPDGHAASLLAKWLKLPFVVTLRGSEKMYAMQPAIRKHIVNTLETAVRVLSVSDSLRRLALALGAPDKTAQTVSNAVDSQKFRPMDRNSARERLNLPPDAQVLISVGWLVEVKGFHRVIECLPDIRERYPNLRYLIVGGASAAGSMETELRHQVRELMLDDCVYFLGPKPQDELKWMYSAADIFVLATRREGWANVFLEAMACGLPVVTTDVDGNPEVVCRDAFGRLVPFGDTVAFRDAILQALGQPWDRSAIRAYAEENSWDERVLQLRQLFHDVLNA